MLLRGGCRSAAVEVGGMIGTGTDLIVGGFVDRSIGAGGDACFLGLEDDRLESSEGLGGGRASVRLGGRPGRASSRIGG